MFVNNNFTANLYLTVVSLEKCAAMLFTVCKFNIFSNLIPNLSLVLKFDQFYKKEIKTCLKFNF